MTAVTSWPLYLYDLPKSPWSVVETYLMNCSGKSGWSSPHRARRSARAAADWFGLCDIRSGDPGIARNRMKLSTTIPTIVRIA